MATEIFARIGDIKGESRDARHPDEIVVQSFSWGVTNTAPPAGGGGGAAGKPVFQALSLVHAVDRATPALLLACATGKRLRDATITHRKAGAAAQEFLVITLSEVVVTGVTHTGETATPYAEVVTLTFAKVDFAYRMQKPDGSLDVPVQFKYDLKTNTAG